MNETNIDETIDNEEIILTEAEVKDLEGKKEEDLTDLEKKNKKLYARTKETEEKRKVDLAKFSEDKAKLEARIKELEGSKEDTKNNVTELDPIEFAKKVRTLSTLEDEEISYAQILAKGMDKKVEEVIATPEFKTWADARKEKIKSEKGLDPQGRFNSEQKKDPFFEKFSSNLPKGFDFKK